MAQTKFINRPENISMEVLEGLALANASLLEITSSNLVINKGLTIADRVTVVTIGGAGNEPALEGYVGEGMIDIAVIGDIFAAPGYRAILEALQLADKGKGVLLVISNHNGDVLSAKKAINEAEKLGLNVKMVVVRDDVANGPGSDPEKRRGLVGCIPLYKIAGAAAANDRSLSDIFILAQNFANNMATIGVASKAATHPLNGAAFAVLGENEMEIGMGQHGEGGGGRYQMQEADATAVLMANLLISDLNLKSGEEIMVIVNGTGSTTIMEMLIVYRKIHHYLAEKRISIVANWVEEILTVQEQAGFQLFFARMNAETTWYWNAPARTPYLVK